MSILKQSLEQIDRQSAEIGTLRNAAYKLAEENVRLRGAIEAIQKATVEGRVCDDVAWFDTITTLYDFCDQTLAYSSALESDAAK